MKFTPYLNFNGTCAEAFRFYAELLGGEIVESTTFGETPAAAHVPADFQDRVMHAVLAVGDQTIFGSDAPSENYAKPQGAYVALQVDSPAEAERIYQALAEGGTVEMPLAETFWAARFGMLVDRYGTPWMINCPPQQ
ncbi:VOC family protein [Sphaerobacter thermophilus]|jgi:PhnB protein|uniref:VOC family protein n=1 Tax=Sphaerobacter thermophilus TaxID=2057 RepID=UPI0039C431B0